ncbi:MAG TPA: hypothetical protein ENJ15_03775 [Caldithrix abyssi]|uniref:SGNH hydrolase-type esterase domain-containing protein n=1 Tax=Caldithrix abyssi TaxID=187145 RepID=A0A7V5VEK4_CALAY|nr:hypothetical protein [Caldithrix abyssi]
MRTAHWRQRCRVMENEARRASADAVVFLGDSLTELFDLDYFFKMAHLVNHGISGDHIDGARERLPLSQKARPQQLWLMIGINDLFDGREDDHLFAEYGLLLDALDFCPRVMVQSLLPTGASWRDEAGSRVAAVNRFLRDESKKRGFFFVDLYRPFSRSLEAGKRLFQPDDIHLNERAYALWSARIKDLIFRPGA